MPTGGLQKSNSVQVIEFKTRSLHFNQRKAELERIERENQKIAKKIFGLKSDLNKDKFRQEFQQHEAIKHNLARIRKRRVPQFGGKVGQLPPITSERQGSAPLNSDDANRHLGSEDGQMLHQYQTENISAAGQNQDVASAPAGKGADMITDNGVSEPVNEVDAVQEQEQPSPPKNQPQIEDEVKEDV